MIPILRIEGTPSYSAAVICDGKSVKISGQVPSATTEGIVAQSEEVFAKIDALLAKVGTSKSNLLTATVILVDEARDFAAFDEAWRRWVEADNLPTRVTLGARLVKPEWLVEITVEAARQ